MPRNPPGLRFIQARLRERTSGILSIVDPGESLQTTGILSALSPPGAGFRLDVLAEPPSAPPDRCLPGTGGCCWPQGRW